MERRKGGPRSVESALTRSSPLPVDYLKMVTEVFSTNFDEPLQTLAKLIQGKPRFEVTGAIYSDEVVLCVSLVEEEQIAATSVYASSDFDPKASAPTIQDLLSACVDGIGAVYAQILSPEHPERLEQVASSSLAALDSIPFYWSEAKLDRYRIHIKVDKTNPKLDVAADEWLRNNDPELKLRSEQDEEETKSLFVTGPSTGPGAKKPGGTVH